MYLTATCRNPFSYRVEKFVNLLCVNQKYHKIYRKIYFWLWNYPENHEYFQYSTHSSNFSTKYSSYIKHNFSQVSIWACLHICPRLHLVTPDTLRVMEPCEQSQVFHSSTSVMEGTLASVGSWGPWALQWLEHLSPSFMLLVHPAYLEAPYFAKAWVYYQGFQVGKLENCSLPSTCITWLFPYPFRAYGIKYKGSLGKRVSFPQGGCRLSLPQGRGKVKVLYIYISSKSKRKNK